MTEKGVTDLLGTAALNRAVETATTRSFDGVGAILKRVCLPAAEEFGRLLQDCVSDWRKRNAERVAAKAAARLSDPAREHDKASPRIVFACLEQGSWTEDSELQDMWAGLLASACAPTASDESNLLFVNLLSQLTSGEVRVLNACCSEVKKSATPKHGLIVPVDTLEKDVDELLSISGAPDIHHLDRELDHLRSLELIRIGIDPTKEVADVTPSSLALNLYVRCKGSRKSPVDYFDLGAGGPGATTDANATSPSSDDPTPKASHT